MGRLIYITHPNVDINAEVPVPQWGLNARGRTRAVAMLQQPWISTINRVLTSRETKAAETASILADFVGVVAEERSHTGETDRSATGFVPAERHEELANRFFALPTTSADGWERAIDAQYRIVSALRDVVAPGDDTIAVVGHGAVGTLLMCHLDDRAIDRCHDQPTQGHYWVFDREASRLLHDWRSIDEL